MRIMKNWIPILLTLIALSSFGQNKQPKELGIGFSIATNPYQFEDLSIPDNIFKDKELTQKWDSDKVFPFFFKPDYGLYHFVCLEKTIDYYKILVNDNEIAYLPNDTNYYFKTWEAMILQSKVERLTKDNPIRQECDDKSGIVEYNCEYDRLTVQDVVQKNGEYWLEIHFSPECEEYPSKNSKVKYGWIKWRTNNKLLVEILLLC